MFRFNQRQATSKRRVTRRRPSLEALEGRVVLSTLHVNTLLDTDAVHPNKSPVDKNGNTSLRSAMAGSADTFFPSASGSALAG